MKKQGDSNSMDEVSVPSRLRRAIIRGDALMVKGIIRDNPKFLQNPDYNDKSNTCLHLAATLGHLDVMKTLVESGHDACDSSSTTSISSSSHDRHSAPGTSLNADFSTPLHLAAAHARADCVDYLCTTFSDTIDRRDKNGVTALMLAAQSSGPTSPLLSTNLVPPTASSTAHRRPRSASNPPEDTSSVVTLLMHKAAIATKDNSGNTALHYASGWGNLKAFRLLVSAGIPPLEENDGGWTAADYASTMAAATYCRALVAEFEQLKEEEPVLRAKQQMPPLKMVSTINTTSAGEGSSPISPADGFSRREATSKPSLTITRPETIGPGSSVRFPGQEDYYDYSSDEDMPLTARKISMSDEDPFGSFSGGYDEYDR